MNTQITWIPLLDYALKKGISLSTLRRYIKAKKVQYRLENGRYLLLDDEGGMKNVATQATPARDETNHLRTDLQRAKEEIAELKTLIAFYEEKISHSRIDG